MSAEQSAERKEELLRALEAVVDGTLDPRRHHYVVERELAERLRRANAEERRHLYQEVYDLLFQQVTDHPLIAPDVELRKRVVQTQVTFLEQMISRDGVFMEVGSGDCQLAIAMAARVRHVFAVDVSVEISKHATFPRNCEFIVSDGCRIPVPANSVTLAFSDQLMEHLHPDDAVEQLREIYNALKPGGLYVFFTPNRLSGPHDVSKYFDRIATGFHLKEYTTWELSAALRAAGFHDVRVPVQVRGLVKFVPSWLVSAAERALALTPRRVQRQMALHRPMKKALGRVAAIK